MYKCSVSISKISGIFTMLPDGKYSQYVEEIITYWFCCVQLIQYDDFKLTRSMKISCKNLPAGQYIIQMLNKDYTASYIIATKI